MAAPLTLSVYARVRPPNDAECRTDGSAGAYSWHSAVDVVSNRALLFNPARLKALAPPTPFATVRRRLLYDQMFQFDGVIGPEASQYDVYCTVAQPLLATALAGRNASIFAYGATGCGKSHTIKGITDQVAANLFASIADLEHEGTKVTVTVTYVQLYQERLEDLLPAERRVKRGGCGLDLRDMNLDLPGEARVPGLCEYRPSTAAELAELCARGDHNRTVAATNANSLSSRSHAVLNLHISQVAADGAASESSLSIIDLAGSERAQSTQNEGARLAEGASINRSLLALGNVINACCSQKQYIPFRESKLTRLLRHSLTGNCHTAMIVCVSPSFAHFDETRNSLEYGRRAASITRRSNLVPAIPRQPTTMSQIQTRVRQHLFAAISTEVTAQLPELEFERHVSALGDLTSLSSEGFANALVTSISRSMAAAGPHVTGSSAAAVSRSSRRPLENRRNAREPHTVSPTKRVRSASGQEYPANGAPSYGRRIRA